MELIIINLVKSFLMTIFTTSIITIKDKKHICAVSMILANYIINILFNYFGIEKISSFLILIFINTYILNIFINSSLYEIVFSLSIESLYCSITNSLSLIVTTFIFKAIPLTLMSQLSYLSLMSFVINHIRKKEVYYNKKIYINLSLIIIFLQYLINIMTIFFINIYEKYNNFLFYYLLFLFFSILVLSLIFMISEFYQEEIEYNIQYSKKENLAILDNLYTELKIMKHDFKHDLDLLEYYLLNERYNEIYQYISSKKDIIKSIPVLINSKNELINTIINNKMYIACTKGITFKTDIIVEENININSYDLNSLLSNVLDNAIENTYENGTILLKIKQDQQILNIRVENTIKEISDFKSKKDKRYHGYGLKSVKYIADKYYGKINISQQCDIFCITITLLLM